MDSKKLMDRLYALGLEDNDVLSRQSFVDVLSDDCADMLIEFYDLEFNNNGEIIIADLKDLDNFDKMCKDDDFIGVLSAYFDAVID